MLIRIICWGFAAIMLGCAGFHLGKIAGYDKKAEAERQRLKLQEIEAQEHKESFCLHCKHGMPVVRESGAKGWVTRVECECKAECERFERATAEGQSRKSQWRL